MAKKNLKWCGNPKHAYYDSRLGSCPQCRKEKGKARKSRWV